VLADSLLVANWAVAGGTIAVAVGTLVLAFFTFRSVQGATAELRLERDRLVAAQTPRVFPTPPIEWSEGAPPYNMELRLWPTVLPVTNGGPGVALNVRARLEWPGAGGQYVGTVPSSIAPGQFTDLRINWGGDPLTDWANVVGALTYEDIHGTQWRTNFTVTTEAQGRRNINVGDTIGVNADPPTVTIGDEGWLRTLLDR
jgi:hypothetical protein